MPENDPTDHALAAIASILDNNNEQAAAIVPDEPVASNLVADATPEVEVAPEIVPETASVARNADDIDGYSKTGPGPLAAIRFKWTARRDSVGYYFVDETIGENSRPMTTGPMSKDEALTFIDERERATRQRFNAIRGEMAVGTATPLENALLDDGKR